MTEGLTTGPGEIRTWVAETPWVFNPSANGSAMAARISMVTPKAFQVADGAAAVDLLVSGDIIGNGQITKTGSPRPGLAP